MDYENDPVPAVTMSVEMEALLGNTMNSHHLQHAENHQSEDVSLAPNAAELEEEEGAIDEVEETMIKPSSSSWLRTLWIISLYIPFLIQLLFGASFYIIRTLLLGYFLQYTVQFCTVAEHWTFQWLGIENHGKHNSTPLPALMGLGLLTLMALVVHPDGYTWVLLRKIRDGLLAAVHSSSTCWEIAVHDYGAIVSSILALATFASLFFLVYVLHRTLAPKAPPDAHRQGDKHRRKKSKFKGHGRGKGNGKQRTIQLENQSKLNDDDQTHLQETSETLPPLVEDQPVLPSTVPLTSAPVRTWSMDDDEQRLEPLRDRATSSSTLDSTTSSVDSGRSTPTAISVAESTSSSTPIQLNTSVEMNKAKVRPTGSQNRNHNEGSRRNHNSRRGKKTDITGASSRGAGPPTTPSRRWDALKPASRASSGSRRATYTSSNKPLWGHDIGDQGLKERKAPTRQDVTAHSPSNGYNISYDPSQTNQHGPPLHFFSGGAGNQDFAQPHSDYSTNVYLNAHSTLFETPARANADARSGTEDISSTPLFFSSLNPESPSWEDRQVRARTSSDGMPIIRPPPGMESVPYGCESSDGGFVAGSSPHQTLPSVSNVATANRSTPSPFLLPGPEYFYAPRFDNVRTTLPFGFHSQHSPHVKENPFATSSDDDDVDEKIAADLQELGGQMVGSILDF